jgi:hypothetical protein
MGRTTNERVWDALKKRCYAYCMLQGVVKKRLWNREGMVGALAPFLSHGVPQAMS